jgi:hypothetical protein
VASATALCNRLHCRLLHRNKSVGLETIRRFIFKSGTFVLFRHGFVAGDVGGRSRQGMAEFAKKCGAP